MPSDRSLSAGLPATPVLKCLRCANIQTRAHERNPRQCTITVSPCQARNAAPHGAAAGSPLSFGPSSPASSSS